MLLGEEADGVWNPLKAVGSCDSGHEVPVGSFTNLVSGVSLRKGKAHRRWSDRVGAEGNGNLPEGLLGLVEQFESLHPEPGCGCCISSSHPLNETLSLLDWRKKSMLFVEKY